MTNVLDKLRHKHCTVTETGSRVICNPPPTNTDQDFLVEAPNIVAFADALEVLAQEGFIREGQNSNYPTVKGFISWRRRQTNILLTMDPVFASKFRLATATAKSLNLMKKKDRITLFRAILYDEVPND